MESTLRELFIVMNKKNALKVYPFRAQLHQTYNCRKFLLSSRLYCRYRNYTGSAMWSWVADCHRRWGITPRPEELSFYKSYYNAARLLFQEDFYTEFLLSASHSRTSSTLTFRAFAISTADIPISDRFWAVSFRDSNLPSALPYSIPSL